MSAKPLELSLPYKVADLSQAEWGRKEMQLSENEMPGLMAVIEKYGPKKPLAGLRVTGSLHMPTSLPDAPSGPTPDRLPRHNRALPRPLHPVFLAVFLRDALGVSGRDKFVS